MVSFDSRSRFLPLNLLYGQIPVNFFNFVLTGRVPVGKMDTSKTNGGFKMITSQVDLDSVKKALEGVEVTLPLYEGTDDTYNQYQYYDVEDVKALLNSFGIKVKDIEAY